MATCGIYRIKNKQNGKFYVGSSDNIERRFSRHLNDLSKNKHDNSHLQNAWKKYGGRNFDVEIVRVCPKTDLLLEEQRELDIWFGNDICYNLTKIAGHPVAPGEKRPKWVIDKISESQKGKPRWTEEQKKQMSIDRKGRKHKAETIKKFLGRKSAYENIRKAQLFNVGRIYSEEHRKAISLGKINANKKKILEKMENKYGIFG